MKFFTIEWWSSGCEDDSVFDKYQEYLSSVSTKLPKQLLLIQQEFTLHDANVKEIRSDYVNRIVTIILRGWDREFKEKIKYTLRFLGVEQFNQILPQDEYVESELGDLGYWEYEVLDMAVQMRMLFASGAEFEINFNEFEFTHDAVKA